jgi:hypothetical protein
VKKKFLIGLAPLVVVAALLVIPAASQALPHVYKDGVIAAEGKPVRMIDWGVFHFTNKTVGQVECRDAMAGFLENPTGGGQAKGPIQMFSPYECVSAECTAIGGKFIEITGEHLPWVSEITEPSAGVFRQKIGVKGEKGGKGSAELFINCEAVTKGHAFGETSPRVLNNGTTKGLKPGELEFDAGSGEFEGEFPGKIEAKFKQMGFANQEVIEVQNP